MKLYNTLSRRLEELQITNDTLKIYVCGITVYDNSHIGHARTVLIFDLLRRYLAFKNFKVYFVQNFTDVDDKIINRAKKEGVPAEEIAQRYIKLYYQDFGDLNILQADANPKATENINEIIDLINALVKKKYAYIAKNGVYFKVRSFPQYGKLSRKSIEELQTGSRIEIDQTKEDPLDFALWKFSSDDPSWNSPWGMGRPGWHIECSAMALKYLGSFLHIHGGGHDLVFPHHENEIAQSEAYTGSQFAKVWMHTGMVTINGEKMSKSLGNIVTIRQALHAWGPNTIRLYCLSAHYSKPVDYNNELLKESYQRWRQIENCAYELLFASGENIGSAEIIDNVVNECVNAFVSAMENDLDSPSALSSFMKFVSELNRLAATDKLAKDMADKAKETFDKLMWIFGLRISEPGQKERQEIESLIVLRDSHRNSKNFDEADKTRQKLYADYSVELIDHKSRTIWKKVEKPNVM